ncbi:MarR family winged helix-turn-helix transcriptional regulator [Kocuria salsicia]|uniref:MarR family transcriptional regulator n=1 Tax=Kocuria salsicia TaxID=664639 RepID=A0ABV3K8I9_9MICC|nr:MarR family transcriptional regulator [Kocuria rhizophila]
MQDRNQWPTNRLLSTAARLVEHAWNEDLASLGVTHAGVMALDVLRSEGSMTQAQLAHQVRVQAQTMGKTLHRLEVHGHITRSKNEQDRRSHVVSISQAGERVLEDAAGLERGLLGAGDESDEQFRRRLAEIISSLGGARWRKEVQEDPDVGSADTSASVEGVHASVASSSITGAPGSAL